MMLDCGSSTQFANNGSDNIMNIIHKGEWELAMVQSPRLVAKQPVHHQPISQALLVCPPKAKKE